MGNNSLSNTEKSLRSIAKRYENVKYSVGLAVLFLMNGASAFSDTNVVQETDRQKEVAKDSQAGKTVVKETKAEKKQTSQKLKASWVNMQFGANDMYSNYFAVPKAKVEKTSVVKSEKTVLVASADNTASLPMFAKLLTDIEETTENRTEVLTTIANKEETPTMEEIKASKQELRSSVGNLQDKIDTARRENQKEINGLRLELIQLMEQGNQVVKSPWSSWQFGANYFYEDWGGAYKGRGDKAKEKLDLTKKTDPLERFKASSQMSSTYGTTSLDLVYEPPREVEVSAGIRPKEVNKRAPGFVPPEPSGSLPPFEPKIIQPPKAPEVTPPRIDEPAVISYPGFGSSIQDHYSFWNGSPGASGNSSTMMDQIALTAGKFKVTSNEGAYIKGYQGVGGYKATSATVQREIPTGSIPTDGYHALARRFFFGIRNSAFIQWEPEVEISWFNKGTNNNQLIYMETSTTSQQNLETLNAGGAFANSPGLYDAVKAYKIQTALRDDGDGATGINLHNNKGTIYLGGNNTRYQATTTIGGTRLSVFNNEGTIVGMNVHEGNTGENGSTKQVVYFNTPDTSSDQRWIYANGTNGKINLYGSESIAMYYTSSSGTQQQHVKTGFVNAVF